MKELAVPFKIYADFECLLKGVQSSEKIMAHTQKNIKIIFLAVLLISLFVLIINSVKKLSSTEEKMQLVDSLKQSLMSTVIAKK